MQSNGAASGSLDFLSPIVEPWYESLSQPEAAQAAVLRRLVEGYAKTAYGTVYGASSVGGLGDFQSKFPIVTYRDLQPYLDRVREGEYSALLPEPVVRWVMTRGSTGAPKIIPATEAHLSQILALGARGIVNFAIRRKDQNVVAQGILATPHG